jgi:hypothetical protein
VAESKPVFMRFLARGGHCRDDQGVWYLVLYRKGSSRLMEFRTSKEITGRLVIERGSPSSWPSPSRRRNSFGEFISHSLIDDSIQRWNNQTFVYMAYSLFEMRPFFSFRWLDGRQNNLTMRFTQ